MASRHMKICSALLIIREMQIITIMRWPSQYQTPSGVELPGIADREQFGAALEI